MHRLIIVFSLLMLHAGAHAQENSDYCGKAAAQARALNRGELSSFEDLSFDLKYCRFEWYVDPVENAISGTVTSWFTAVNDGIQALEFNLYSQFGIDAIQYHGINLMYAQNSDYGLTVFLPAPVAAGVLDSLSITYHGVPPSSGFGSFIRTDHNGTPVIWTLSEPFGSQDWWPCKNGLTDKIDSVDIIVRTPAVNRVASNGLLVAEKDLGNERIFHWKHRYPIASYLVAIAVTNFTVYTDELELADGTDLTMLNYVYPESLANAQTGTADLIRPLQFYDSLFVRYPFSREKYGHAQFSWGGGMEHQTMSYVSGFNWGLLTHELAHQWFGDMVTCGSWQDIWLNEGFATFLEGLTRERFQGGPDWWNWRNGKVSNITSQPGGSVMVDDTTSVGRIFSGRLSYQKGAYLLHMLRWKLGDEIFFRGVRNYLNDRQYSYAKTPALVHHLEEACTCDLTEYFNDWYFGQGYPSYQVLWSQNSNNQLFVQISQTQSHPSVSYFEMPVPVRFSASGIDTILRFEHTAQGQLFQADLPFEVTSATFDPELWLISANNTILQVSDAHESESQLYNLSVSPNPAVDNAVISFNLPASDELYFNLADPSGRVFYSGSSRFAAGNHQKKLDLTSLPAGSYLLRVCGRQWQSEKVLVKR